MRVATGFATHSGWAVAVTCALDGAGVAVVDRRQVDLIGPDLPRMAYHAAAELDGADRERLIDDVERAIERHSADAIGALAEAVAGGGDDLAAVAIIGEWREIPVVGTVLASHALMHASEGEQYRRGVGEAAAARGIAVVRVGAMAIDAEVTATVGWTADRFTAELAGLGRSLGPPWRKDHKQAVGAALIALDQPAPAA